MGQPHLIPNGHGTLRARWIRRGAFWLAVLLIAGVSGLSYVTVQRLIATADAVDRIQTVRYELEALVSTLKDMETGQRGYLITGDPAYLEPYKVAVRTAPRHLDHLRPLLAANPVQASRLAALDGLVSERLAIAWNVIAERGRTGIVDRDHLDSGKQTMDRVRRVAEAMVATETERHRRLDREASRQAVLANRVLLGGVVTSLLVIGGLYLVTSREVARRRRAERTLAAANAGLERTVAERTAELSAEVEARRRAAEMLAAVIEEAPFALIGLDPERHVMLWNRAAERIFGYAAEEVVGRPYPLVPPDGQAEFEALYRRAIAGERMRNVAVRRRRKDGRLVDIVLSGAPLYQDDGRLRGLVFMLEDVTERRSLEDQLRQAQKMEAVGQLTGGLAHDFNNLLGVIVGNLDLLIESLDRDPARTELAEAALGAATRGADLVQRLLAFARRQPLAPQTVDLNARLPDLVQMLRRTLGPTIEITTITADDLWPALIDPAQVEDAIVNLAINARDAMPKGGRLTIETANAQLDEAYAAQHAEVSPGAYVLIAVSDTGSGMPPEVMARAFEPFFTTKAVGKGSGLGLAQVYGFIKQSGGHIKIYSEPGHGSTIKLYLPRAAVETDQAGSRGPGSAAMSTGTERVLVVEDDAEMRRVAAKQLRDLGYAILEAADARQAIAVLDAGEPVDLLFTDVIMPGGMTGYDLAAEARRRRPDLKILFTSGYTEAAARNGNGGANGALLSKPYRKAELAAKIRAVLDGA